MNFPGTVDPRLDRVPIAVSRLNVASRERNSALKLFNVVAKRLFTCPVITTRRGASHREIIKQHRYKRGRERRRRRRDESSLSSPLSWQFFPRHGSFHHARAHASPDGGERVGARGAHRAHFMLFRCSLAREVVSREISSRDLRSCVRNARRRTTTYDDGVQAVRTYPRRIIIPRARAKRGAIITAIVSV